VPASSVLPRVCGRLAKPFEKSGSLPSRNAARTSRRRTWSPKKCGEAGTTVVFEGFAAIQSTPGK